jgi:Flp pilus assembly protein TadB
MGAPREQEVAVVGQQGQHDNQLVNKRQTGGEASVDRRQQSIKRMRGNGSTTRDITTTSRQRRGEREGVAMALVVAVAVAVAMTVAVVVVVAVAVAVAVAVVVAVAVAVAVVGTLEGGYIRNLPLPQVP